MRRKTIATIPPNDLEQMPTKQLLARLKCLHQCEEPLAASDRDKHYQATPDAVEFKQTPEWAAAYAQVKEVLAQREHIPRQRRASKQNAVTVAAQIQAETHNFVKGNT